MEELKFNRYEVIIDGTDYTNHVPFPLKWSALLDEQLDEASLQLVRVPVDNFEALINVTVKVWNDEAPDDVITHNFLVANDEAKEVPVGSGKYNHSLYLIEETKYLEGFQVRSHGYVDSLNKKFLPVSVNANVVIPENSNILDIKAYPIESPKTSNNEKFPSLQGVWHDINIRQPGTGSFTLRGMGNGSVIEIIQPNGVVYSTNTDISSVVPVTLKVPSGSFFARYTLDFVIVYTRGDEETIGHSFVQFNYSLFYAPNGISDPLTWTARSVIERALILAEPLRQNDCPRFWLNPAQAAEFEKIKVPEFQFTQSNLREILQGIGKYLHGEPRLRGHEVYYDMYGSSEQTEPYSVYAAKEVSRALDRYATNIDSNVGNLVNSLGYAKGVFVEPFDGGALSMRCETMYARIDESNIIFPTKFGINSVEKFEYYDDTNNRFWDITRYVFEAADYNQMSSYQGGYPYAKSYALYYTQGEKNIHGFLLKEEAALAQAFKEPAIVNILTAVTGESVSIGKYQKMQFRITYQAYMPARVQQNKSLIAAKKQFTTTYNQGQNVVESKYFGENLKGVIARLGNVDKVITVVKKGLAKPPKVGTLYDDDYYISTVACEVQPTTTKITLALSKDFNRYSEYVSLDRQKRQYEISEKAAYESMLSYRDYCIIGDATNTYGDSLAPLGNVLKFMLNSQESDVPVTMLKAQGVDSKSNLWQEVALSVQAAAMGNAAVFIASYKDNYSAGESAIEIAGTPGDTATLNYFQQGVMYTDVFGNLEKLHLNYYTGGSPIDNENEFNLASTLPATDYLKPNGEALITTGENPLWVKKGSTEILGINYQIDFVTNRRSIIIGSGFAKFCSLVNGYDSSLIRLYIRKTRLNKFEKRYNIEGATPLSFSGFTMSEDGKTAYFKDFVVQNNIDFVGKSWALVKDYEVILGENREINVGDNIFSGLQITMAHDYLPPSYNGIIEGGYPVTPTQSGDVYTVDYKTDYNNDVWLNIRDVTKNDTQTGAEISVPNGLKMSQDANGVWHIVGKLYSPDTVFVKFRAFKWR